MVHWSTKVLRKAGIVGRGSGRAENAVVSLLLRFLPLPAALAVSCSSCRRVDADKLEHGQVVSISHNRTFHKRCKLLEASARIPLLKAQDSPVTHTILRHSQISSGT